VTEFTIDSSSGLGAGVGVVITQTSSDGSGVSFTLTPDADNITVTYGYDADGYPHPAAWTRGAYDFPDPTTDPTVDMNATYTGNINTVISLASVQAMGHGADAIKAYLTVTGTLTLSIDGTGVTAKGGT